MEFVISSSIRSKRAEAVQMTGVDSNGEAFERIGGCTLAKDIYLPVLKPFSLLRLYFHEMGHVIGSELSFKGGQVLTPSEVKSSACPISITELIRLLGYLSLDYPALYQDIYLMPSANAALSIFTKGNFDPLTVTVHENVSREGIEALVKKNNIAGFAGKLQEDGELVTSYNRNIRNVELPATAVEIGCLWLLEKQLRSYFPGKTMILNEPVFPSHNIAFRIAARAYSHDLIIPSLIDLPPRAA